MTHPTHLIEYRFGRTIGHGPEILDAEAWERFQAEAMGVLGGVAAGLQADTVRQLEQWTELHLSPAGQFEGTTEESAVATLYTDAEDLDGLFEVLASFAREMAVEYGQIAVAVVLGGVGHLIRVEEEV